MKVIKNPDYLIFAEGAKAGELITFPEIERGWGITLEQTQGKPPLEWMNGAFNRVDSHILYLLQQGIPEWNNSVQYPVGAIIKYKDKLYRCLIENSNGMPSTNTTKWDLLIKNASEKDRGIIQLATQQEVDDGLNDLNSITPLKLQKKLEPILNRKTPIYGEYEPSRQYETGDFIKINGVWYECYHPDGCKDIDPTDPKNRPSGWTNQDIHAPYYWIKIGRGLALPEIGSPIAIPSLTLKEGLIKYRNDGQLSALKFWRIAELYPNLVNNGLIEIADLRAMTIRGLDDGRGIDIGRAINSFQSDAIRNITGAISTVQFVQDQTPIGAIEIWKTGIGGIYVTQYPVAPDYNETAGIAFSASRVVPTHTENVVKNIVMLYACRI